MSFPYFVMKQAPVSRVESVVKYDASLIGEIHDGVEEMWIRVVVAATSLCPCSKQISDYGAHNQRCTSRSRRACASTSGSRN